LAFFLGGDLLLNMAAAGGASASEEERDDMGDERSRGQFFLLWPVAWQSLHLKVLVSTPEQWPRCAAAPHPRVQDQIEEGLMRLGWIMRARGLRVGWLKLGGVSLQRMSHWCSSAVRMPHDKHTKVVPQERARGAELLMRGVR
jgi:hypothetical protein